MLNYESSAFKTYRNFQGQTFSLYGESCMITERDKNRLQQIKAEVRQDKSIQKTRTVTNSCGEKAVYVFPAKDI